VARWVGGQGQGVEGAVKGGKTEWRMGGQADGGRADGPAGAWWTSSITPQLRKNSNGVSFIQNLTALYPECIPAKTQSLEILTKICKVL
jgi:hypothetical protein